MKKALWVVLAVGIALAGAWGYGELVRHENDAGQPVRLLAIAEEQSLALSFSRRGRLTTRVPDEGETIGKGDEVARIEEPGLSEDASDIDRQISQVHARDRSRLQEIEKLRAQQAAVLSDERRMSRLVKEGVSPSASLESLEHQRDAIAAEIRAREEEAGDLEAQKQALKVRLDKIHVFEKEGVLISPKSGTVLTRHHREGEWIEPGQAVVTLQIDSPYLRVEVPEERLSSFVVGKTVTVWPQARPNARFQARIVSIKPRSEYASRKNWGLQSRDLQTFSVRLQPVDATVVSGQTFVVSAGSETPRA